MVGLPNHLSNLLHPSRHASSRASPPKKAEADMDADDDEQDDDTSAPQVAGKTYCSGEIFSLFKMMAAGKGNQKSLAEEVDSDESEGDEPVATQSKSKDMPQAGQEGADSLRHAGSNTNMQIGGALYDDDDDDVDDESRTVVDEHDNDGGSAALETWRKEHAPNNSDMDAQGQSLAGEYHI